MQLVRAREASLTLWHDTLNAFVIGCEGLGLEFCIFLQSSELGFRDSSGILLRGRSALANAVEFERANYLSASSYSDLRKEKTYFFLLGVTTGLDLSSCQHSAFQEFRARDNAYSFLEAGFLAILLMCQTLALGISVTQKTFLPILVLGVGLGYGLLC